MFYGTITASGTINTAFAFSNNFSISHSSGSGKYTITFNEYMSSSPMLIATPYSDNASGKNIVAVEWSMSAYAAGSPFQALIITAKPNGGGATDEAFSFHARTGQTLMFDAKLNPTLTLGVNIGSFSYTDPSGGSTTNPVLTISAGINGLDPNTAQPNRSGTYSTFFDKGTVLLGIMKGGGTTRLEIPLTVQDSSKNTWTLTGWTYGGAAGEAGTQWTTSGSSSTYDLTLAAIGEGPLPPLTSPETFVIVATCGDQTITSDPVVRLSSVPPGGISL